MSNDFVALVAVVVLAVAHLSAPALSFIRFVPRSTLLSAFGGISVAYVFVHLLPDVAEGQDAVRRATPTLVADIERHTWLLALLGLVVFYGLERRASRSRTDGEAAPGVFWVSMASFAVYNAIVGALAVGRAGDGDRLELVLFVLALGVHFVVNDLGLRHHHRHRYDRLGRPILAGAVLAGWVLGSLLEVSEVTVGVALALVSGGIVLNVIKEELPEERASRFVPFAAAAAGYAAVLLLV